MSKARRRARRRRRIAERDRRALVDSLAAWQLVYAFRQLWKPDPLAPTPPTMTLADFADSGWSNDGDPLEDLLAAFGPVHAALNWSASPLSQPHDGAGHVAARLIAPPGHAVAGHHADVQLQGRGVELQHAAALECPPGPTDHA